MITTKRRWLLRLVVAAVVVLGLIGLVFLASPRPGVWLISWVFDQGARTASQALEKHLPEGVETVSDLSYSSRWPELRLDVHRPATQTGASWPAIVWVHGGAWVSGRKEDVANYLRIIAARGFVVVAMDYTLAPDARHPTQLWQVNEALAFAVREASNLKLDPHRVLLAGDSAGAQLAAQLAAATTSPAYAEQLDLRPALMPAQLRGALLFCGPYDLEMVRLEGPFGFFLRTVLWAFTGQRETQGNPAVLLASVLRHVTPAFPPAFISAGSDDPLLPHSMALAERLKSMQVPVQPLFFPTGHQPPLGHEYQFDLDQSAGREALEALVRFAQQRAR